MAISISKEAMNNQGSHLSFTYASIFGKFAEMMWFFLSFLLFIVLGPFSAPIALIALFQLGCEDGDQPSPKPLPE